MLNILSEFLNEILIVVFMLAVISAAVFSGHKFRDFMDKKKAGKGENK